MFTPRGPSAGPNGGPADAPPPVLLDASYQLRVTVDANYLKLSSEA